MGFGENRAVNVNIRILWDLVFYGSPTVAAIALAVLDKMLDGKILELKNKILEKGDMHEIFRKSKIIG